MTGFDDAAEQRRLDALFALDILDTPPERAFDRITALARFTFQVPIATVTLIDRDRQWFKSKQGLDTNETAREIAFCNYTIQQSTALVIPDAALDPRTSRNPLVLGEPHIRFYAGVPLILANGERVGSLCIIDRKPRQITEQQLEILRNFAAMVVEEFELRLVCDGDALTGARTRRAFLETLTVELLRSRRNDRPLSVLAFSVPDATSIAQTHGQTVTDAILVRSVEACRNALHEEVCVGRIGAADFAILLPEIHLPTALEIMRHLSGVVAKLDIRPLKTASAFRIVFGAAERGPADVSASALLEAARLTARLVTYCGPAPRAALPDSQRLTA